MRDSVPSGSYSSVCNVLRQWQSRSSLLIESTDSMTIEIDEEIHTVCDILKQKHPEGKPVTQSAIAV